MNATEIVVTTVGVLGSALAAFLAYKRGSQSDTAASENVATEQVYAGYGGLLQRIQDDNTDLRRRLAGTERRLAACEQLGRDSTELKRKLAVAEQRLDAAEQRIALLLTRLGDK